MGYATEIILAEEKTGKTQFRNKHISRHRFAAKKTIEIAITTYKQDAGNYPQNYIDAIKNQIGEQQAILATPTTELIDALKVANIPFTLVYFEGSDLNSVSGCNHIRLQEGEYMNKNFNTIESLFLYEEEE